MKALARQRYFEYLEREGKLPKAEEPELAPDDAALEEFEIEDEPEPEAPQAPSRSDFIRALQRSNF